jgi:hypothetical protein
MVSPGVIAFDERVMNKVQPSAATGGRAHGTVDPTHDNANHCS